MTTTELLQLEWAVLEPEIRKELNEVLNPGPWEHNWEKKILGVTCDRCGIGKGIAEIHEEFCPVPPPITLEPEVVAERLRDQRHPRLDAAVGHVWGLVDPGYTWWYWFGFIATPTQRIVVCLLALGDLKEENKSEGL